MPSPATQQTVRGPIFVAGRQHCGNTVLTKILADAPGCYATSTDENDFFERRGQCDRIRDPARRASRVVELMRLTEDELRCATMHRLRSHQDKRPDASALELYSQGMSYVARSHGSDSWVQKATSYIFYAEEILRSMPDAQMIYLLRNPYDICASRKRREPRAERVFAVTYSWNKGLEIADRLQREMPERFHIVRYEDMVREPDESVRKVFEFTNMTFDPELLNVPHVNRSEAAYTETSEQRGLNGSRVFYFTDVLSHVEVAAVDRLVNTELIRRFYPDLPLMGRPAGPWERLRARLQLVVAPLRYALVHVSRFLREPGATLARVTQRLG